MLVTALLIRLIIAGQGIFGIVAPDAFAGVFAFVQAPPETRKLPAVTSIQPCALPADALLARYTRDGAYTDCFSTEIARAVSHEEYVEAFYTAWVFKLERLLLTWLVSRPSTDAQARELANGTLSSFSAWSVEGRARDQLLMCDLNNRTRSWLMVAPGQNGGASSTRLYFGSAVVPVNDGVSGQRRLGWPFEVLLSFHKLYSRILLHGACRRLQRSGGKARAPSEGTTLN